MNVNYKFASNSLKNTKSNMVRKYFSESINSKPNELQTLLKQVDDSQKMSFEEKLILVDENDNKIASTSKIDAHLRSSGKKMISMYATPPRAGGSRWEGDFSG